MAGAFIVFQDEQDPRDIHFKIGGGSLPVPKEQLDLKTDIESVLTVMRIIFPDDKDFSHYFRPLLSLAQAGLVGEHARPSVAAGALAALKNEITAREAGKIKNRYMKDLGVKAAALATIALAGAVGIRGVLAYKQSQLPSAIQFANFLFLWAGCMAGVWLSFGARKTVFRFEDLHIPEEDRLEPFVRLFFAGLLTVIIGLIFTLKAVVVQLGGISSVSIIDSVRVSLLVGLLGGFSEQVLSTAVAKQAARMFDFGKP